MAQGNAKRRRKRRVSGFTKAMLTSAGITIGILLFVRYGTGIWLTPFETTLAGLASTIVSLSSRIY